MSESVGKIPKPIMRGMLHQQIRTHLIVSAVLVTAGGLYMKFVYGNGVKARFAEFYKNYDIEKEFEKMRQKGLFDSC